MSSRVFMRGISIVKTKRKIQAKTIGIVLAVILLLLCAALVFAGNFLFNFALNPNASFTMNNLIQGGDVEGIGDGPALELSPARENWREYSANAYDWFASEGQSVTYQRPDGSVLRASYFPQQGHKYAILFHGYTGAAWQMASFGKVYYDMGWSILTPDALPTEAATASILAWAGWNGPM